MTRYGFVAIGRPTFDVGFAEQQTAQAHRTLVDGGLEPVGTASVFLDIADLEQQLEILTLAKVTTLIVFQATFADSTLIDRIAEAFDGPLVLWAVPEERTGGRLRLNSLCGVNLAGYVLKRRGASYHWVYGQADDAGIARRVVDREVSKPALVEIPSPTRGAPPSVDGKVIGVIGTRPDGFEPCDFVPDELSKRFGVTTDVVTLDRWWAASDEARAEDIELTRSSLDKEMIGLSEVEQPSLERSLRLHSGLESLTRERSWDGIATRCWPECFTEYGGAACAGNSIMTGHGVPSSCEADVYGTLTALLLQELSEDPPFVADLIDLDPKSNTAVFWHCGQAPKQLSNPDHVPRATVHSNRRKPLLNEFPLKPGAVTIARISQSAGAHRLVLGSATMLDSPIPFSGTSGVAQLESDVGVVLDTIMSEGLEHHYGIAYGDHVSSLEAFAAGHDLAVIRL